MKWDDPQVYRTTRQCAYSADLVDEVALLPGCGLETHKERRVTTSVAWFEQTYCLTAAIGCAMLRPQKLDKVARQSSSINLALSRHHTFRRSRQTTSHFFLSVWFSRPPSLSAAQSLLTPVSSSSYISTASRPLSVATSKKAANFARPVWKPAMQKTRASGDKDKKCSIERTRFSCW